MRGNLRGVVLSALLMSCGLVPKDVKDFVKDYALPIGSIIAPGAIRTAEDFDGDGQADDIAFDVDGDGKIDAVDIDGDLTLDAFDFNGDGVFLILADLDKEDAQVTVEVDTDGDGKANGVDYDGDGTADGGTDENNDGKPDTTPPTAPPADEIADVDPMREDPRPEPPPPTPNTPPVPEKKVTLADKFPKPGNQGKLGSCAAWTTAAAATYLRAVRENVPADTVWASAAYLYAEMLGEIKAMCDSGTALYHGAEQLTKIGAPSLTAVPYSDTACIMRNANPSEAHKFRIGGWLPLNDWSRDQIKDYIRKGYPVIFGTTLPPNFSEWGGEKACNEAFKSDDGQMAGKHGGGHAMVLIGFDDDKSAYHIQNSWSEDWGCAGRYHWDYADLEARKPHGFVLFPSKAAPAALTAPSSAATVSSAGSIISANKKTITVALQASEPVFVTEATFDFAPNVRVGVEQTVNDGFFAATFTGMLPNPTNPAGYEIALKLKLRDGTQITRNVVSPLKQSSRR